MGSLACIVTYTYQKEVIKCIFYSRQVNIILNYRKWESLGHPRQYWVSRNLSIYQVCRILYILIKSGFYHIWLSMFHAAPLYKTLHTLQTNCLRIIRNRGLCSMYPVFIRVFPVWQFSPQHGQGGHPAPNPTPLYHPHNNPTTTYHYHYHVPWIYFKNFHGVFHI